MFSKRRCLIDASIGTMSFQYFISGIDTREKRRYMMMLGRDLTISPDDDADRYE